MGDLFSKPAEQNGATNDSTVPENMGPQGQLETKPELTSKERFAQLQATRAAKSNDPKVIEKREAEKAKADAEAKSKADAEAKQKEGQANAEVKTKENIEKLKELIRNYNKQTDESSRKTIASSIIQLFKDNNLRLDDFPTDDDYIGLLLSKAIKENDVEIVKQFLKVTEKNKYLVFEKNVLLTACMNDFDDGKDRTDMIEFMLNQKIKPNISDNGKSCLFYVINNEKIRGKQLKLLIEKGVDLENEQMADKAKEILTNAKNQGQITEEELNAIIKTIAIKALQMQSKGGKKRSTKKAKKRTAKATQKRKYKNKRKSIDRH